MHDLSNSLARHNVKELLRAKMVDWAIEVIGNYQHTCSEETYFRAIAIFDFYLKSTSV